MSDYFPTDYEYGEELKAAMQEINRAIARARRSLTDWSRDPSASCRGRESARETLRNFPHFMNPSFRNDEFYCETVRRN